MRRYVLRGANFRAEQQGLEPSAQEVHKVGRTLAFAQGGMGEGGGGEGVTGGWWGMVRAPLPSPLQGEQRPQGATEVLSDGVPTILFSLIRTQRRRRG